MTDELTLELKLFRVCLSSDHDCVIMSQHVGGLTQSLYLLLSTRVVVELMPASSTCFGLAA